MDLSRHLNSTLRLRHFLIVLAIAEHGSLARASEELFITQPAMSRSLREIEQNLGVQLFERTPHGMRPTPAGRACVEHAGSIYGHLEAMRRRISEVTDPDAGSVGVGVHVAGADVLVPRATAALCDRWPRITVRIREAPPATLISELDRGDLDVLVGRMTDHPSTAALARIPLYREPFMVVVSVHHPIARRLTTAEAAVSLAELVHLPWAVPTAGTPLRDALELNFASRGLNFPSRLVECAAPTALRTLITESHYVAVLPVSAAAQDQELKILPLELDDLAQHLGLLTVPGRRPTRAAQLMIDFMVSAAAEISGRANSGHSA